MKQLKIEIRVDDTTGSNKIASAWQTVGYSREKVTDLLEMIGLIDNFKDILKDKIKTLKEIKLE